jgi:hypothetical protein
LGLYQKSVFRRCEEPRVKARDKLRDVAISQFTLEIQGIASPPKADRKNILETFDTAPIQSLHDMIQPPNLRLWEQKLKSILDDLDEILENEFGDKFPLHPARPERGVTASKSQDGLFDISANFTLGLGSEHGKGYVIDIRMVTLEKIPEEIEDRIEKVAVQYLHQKLQDAFPDKKLRVSRDGPVIKLHGDLSLGEL